MSENKKKIKGSTVIITFMYLTWVIYIIALVCIHLITDEWLPTEATLCTAGLFIAETVSLARLKMAKEGVKLQEKNDNTFLEQAGVGNIPDFEEEVQEIVNGRHARKDDEGCE